MSIGGRMKIDCSDAFPFGVALVGDVTPAIDFEKSSKDNRIQERDKETGKLVWQVDIMDFDPEARARTMRLKVAADVQPVPPDAIANAPIRPVYLEGLTVTPYVKETGNGRARVAYSLRATGLAAPRTARDSKAA